MNLIDALRQIALAGGLNADELIAYAAEDTYGGREAEFSGMAIHAVEGRVLYALVRALRPTTCVEVGTCEGASATHILAALAANGKGKLISIDIDDRSGHAIPDALRDRWTLNVADALTADLPKKADFVFEDGAHDYAFTLNILTRLKALNPRAILSHDYYTHHVYQGFDVERAFGDALGSGSAGVGLDGAFTGLGYWFNPAREG